MKISIAGIGYVGLANAILLAQHNEVTAVDLVPEKVEMINARKSPLADREIEEYLVDKPLHLTATTDGNAAYRNADFVVISTPTNYDPVKNYFDTSSVGIRRPAGFGSQSGRCDGGKIHCPSGIHEVAAKAVPKRTAAFFS